MARFFIKSIISTIVTMLLVSLVLFFLLEASSTKEDLVEKMLGVFVTPEQNASFQKQIGLDRPAWLRYSDWLLGNDWRANGDDQIGPNITRVYNSVTNEQEWWIQAGNEHHRYEMNDNNELVTIIRPVDGASSVRVVTDDLWKTGPILVDVKDADGNVLLDASGEIVQEEVVDQYFWGIDSQGRGAKWYKNYSSVDLVSAQNGWQAKAGAPVQYIPLSKGILRGDGGTSLATKRPVFNILPTRIRNTAVLAGTAFVIVMPLALLLGIIAGINEGKFIDRLLSISGLAFAATPEFVVGVFLILTVGVYWSTRWVPGWVDSGIISEGIGAFLQIPAITVFTSDDVIFTKLGPFTVPNLRQIFLPVLTLTFAELGYIIRMTRASMVEVMNTSYIRTAIIKGLPYRRVVMKHAVRNALMAPITIIMLHVNYLIGGVVVVESIFGYPGLGKYIYDASVFGDFNAIEAAAMVTVLIAVATRLIGDFIYMMLNPRIRYG